MDEDPQRARRPNPADPGERKGVDTWDDPAEHPTGSVSASDTARPRDREAVEGDEGVVTGFTTTSSSGSQSGRSLYGIAPDDEPEAPKE